MKKNDKTAFILYSVLFGAIAILLVVYLNVIKKSLVGNADAFNGYYPGFVYIGNYIRHIPYNLINYHRLPTYDFLLGFGNNIFETISVGGDPFNWISAFFPGELSLVGYEISILLRLYIGGIGFFVWAKKHSINCYAIVAGALSYAYCGYAIYTGIAFYNYLTAFTAFPFIVAGVDEVIEVGKRFSWALFFGIILIALDGFQFLYMDTVFFAFYIIVRETKQVKGGKNKGILFRDCVSILIHYILSVGLSSPFFIPDLIGHLRSSRSNVDISSIFVHAFFDQNQIADMLKGVVTNNLYINGLCMGTLAFLCLVIFMIDRKRLDYSIIVLISVLGHFFLGVHVLMNCFVYAYYAVGRWEYIIYFCIAMAMVFVLDDAFKGKSIFNKEKASDKEKHFSKLTLVSLTIFSVFVTIWLILTLYNGLKSIYNIVVFLIILASWVGAVVVFLLKGKKRIVVALSVVVMSVIVGGVPRFSETDSFMDSNIYQKIINSNYAIYSKKDAANGFFRTDVFDTASGRSLITGTNGTSSYFSVQNDALYNFYRDMACSFSIFGGNVNMNTLDGRKSLEVLMSVGTYADVGNASIIHNNYDMKLPIAFAYDSYMLNTDLSEMDPLTRSDLVLRTAYLDDEPDLQIEKLERDEFVSPGWEQIPIEVDYSEVEREGDWVVIKNKSNIYLRYPKGFVKNDENTEYYLYIKSIEMDRSLSTIGFSRLKSIRFTDQGEAANEKGEYLIKLAINDSVINNGYIDLSPLDGRYKFRDIQLRKLDISGYWNYYEKLASHSMRDVSITPNKVSGKISVDKDSVLFASILYDDRWKCSVDGYPTKIHKADSGFSAVEIRTGEHEVVFTYNSDMEWIMLVVFLISVTATIVLWRHKNPEGE